MTVKLTNQIVNIASASEIQTKPEPRLGLINYINSLPFVLPIIDGKIKVAAEPIFAEPAELNALYGSQNLDLGAMSAFSFLQQGNLKLMPGISIASQAVVGSVLFFSKRDIEVPSPLRIAVPIASASAVNLLLLLMLEQGSQMPSFITSSQPDLSEENIDAALVIGDYALAIDQFWCKQYHRRDLAQWWNEKYSLPAIFGVFAARNAWHTADNEHIFQTINKTLIESAKFGLNEYFEKVLDKAEAKTALPRIRLAKYFKEELDYNFDSQHQLALNKYETLCRQYGLLT